MNKYKTYDNCILIISHSNYLIKSGGLEKFIKDYCNVLKQNNIHYIHAFPIIEINKKTRRFGKEFVGISLNDIFLGIWNLDRFADKVNDILDEFSFHLSNCQIHHFHGWNTKKLSNELKQLNVPVYFIVHDLESIAPCMNRPESEKKCRLKISIAGTSTICKNCMNRVACVKEQLQVEYAFIELNSLIKKVYTPSENTKKHFIQIYPQFRNNTIVRGHLKYEMSKVERKINDPIRIAYLGSIAEHKGYMEWKDIIVNLPSDKYSLYYFGIAEMKDNRIKSIKVDSRDPKLKSMTEQLQEYNIDIAFLWSKVPETYCYTYYEAIEAGCFVLTNCSSGNISDGVTKYKNGKIFNDILDCFEYLCNDNLTRKSIENFTKYGKKPINVQINDSLIGDISEYSCENNRILVDIDKTKKHGTGKSRFISLIYRSMRMR